MPSIQTPDLIRDSWKAPVVVAHRGGAAYHAENTREAYQAAIEMGMRMSETDIHLSQDGEMVVMHDKTLDRTTSLKGAVVETPWATMKKAGIPSLADLLQVTKDRTNLIIEIKDGVGIEQKMVDLLKKEKMIDQTVMFSFAGERVKLTKELSPKTYSVWLSAKKPELPGFFDTVKSYGADAFGVQFKNCTPELVAAAHARKMPIFVWTVPPGPEIDRLKALKVNFIITDHPKDVQEQLFGIR